MLYPLKIMYIHMYSNCSDWLTWYLLLNNAGNEMSLVRALCSLKSSQITTVSSDADGTYGWKARAHTTRFLYESSLKAHCLCVTKRRFTSCGTCMGLQSYESVN